MGWMERSQRTKMPLLFSLESLESFYRVTLNLSTHPNVVVLTLILVESMTISGPNIVASMVV